MNLSTNNITQNLPACFTIDGRQYEFKVQTKTAFIDVADPKPPVSINNGVVFGSEGTSIVGTSEIPFNIFLDTANRIIPLKYTAVLMAENKSPLNFYDSFVYTVVNGVNPATILDKTTKAQFNMQGFLGSNFASQLLNFPIDYKILKDDFFVFENPERIIWTNQGFSFAIVDYTPVVNGGIWNQIPPLDPALAYYYTQVFSYIQLL
jgi:hypothetical protein